MIIYISKDTVLAGEGICLWLKPPLLCVDVDDTNAEVYPGEWYREDVESLNNQTATVLLDLISQKRPHWEPEAGVCHKVDFTLGEVVIQRHP